MYLIVIACARRLHSMLKNYSGSNHISGPVSCFGHREMYDSKGRGEKSFFIEIAVNLLLYSLFIFLCSLTGKK